MTAFLSSLLIPGLVLAAAIAMMVTEAAVPGRSWPKVTHWYARAIAANLVQAGVIVLTGFTSDRFFRAHRLFDAGPLGVTVGALVGYVVSTFVYYWWHRWRHQFSFLWLWFHQFHHSPQRIEVVTSFYKHPFELLANGLLSSAVLYLGCGLDKQAAAYAMLLSGLAELVYHWNVKTPRWLGYLFQRPEMHCVHHQEGVHSFNFGDLPIWDMLFGTFNNPPAFEERCGFGDANEHRVLDLLRGVDVNAAPSDGKEPAS